MLIHIARDDGYLMLNPEFIWQKAKQLGRTNFKLDVGRVLRVDLADLFLIEALRPSRVLQRLSNYISGSLVSLQLENVQDSIRVDRQQIDDAAKIGANLTTDHQKRLTENRWVLLQQDLELLLVRCS